MSTRDRLHQIRAAERRAAEMRARRAGVETEIIQLDGRPMIRITRHGALVATLTEAQARACLTEGTGR